MDTYNQVKIVCRIPNWRNLLSAFSTYNMAAPRLLLVVSILTESYSYSRIKITRFFSSNRVRRKWCIFIITSLALLKKKQHFSL